MRITKQALGSLPDWARTHIDAVKAERAAALERAAYAERHFGNQQREIARLKVRIAELESR